jgi:hypothetical protein
MNTLSAYVIQAGIDIAHLSLSLEPEAAALYVKEICLQRKDKRAERDVSAFRPGSKFMMLDLGGNRVRLCVTFTYQLLPILLCILY